MISPCPLYFSYMCWGPVKLWYSLLKNDFFGWFWVVPWGSHYFLRQPPHSNHLNHLPTPPSPAFLAWFRLPPHHAPCAGKRPGANPRWRGRSEWRTVVSRWRCPTESRLTRIQLLTTRGMVVMGGDFAKIMAVHGNQTPGWMNRFYLYSGMRGKKGVQVIRSYILLYYISCYYVLSYVIIYIPGCLGRLDTQKLPLHPLASKRTGDVTPGWLGFW